MSITVFRTEELADVPRYRFVLSFFTPTPPKRYSHTIVERKKKAKRAKQAA